MILYNNDNNAYCSAVNAQKFETGEHNTVYKLVHSYTQETYNFIYI